MTIDKRHPKIAAARKSIANDLRRLRSINREIARIMWKISKETHMATESIIGSIRLAMPDLDAMARLHGIEEAHIAASTDSELRAKIMERMGR